MKNNVFTLLKKGFLSLNLLNIIGLLYFVTPLYCLSVNPGKLELSVAPGEVYKGHYEVSNTSEKPILVKVEVKDWEMDEEGGVNMYEPPPELRLLSKWFRIISDEIVIPPNSSRKIIYQISIPKEASGEYRKYLVFRSMPTKREEKGFGIATQISVPLYVIVKGTEIFKAEISEIEINNIAPIEIKIKVHNLGNVHIRPVGEVIITKKGEEKPLVRMPVNTPSPGWPILPKQSFRFSLYDETKLLFGRYILSATFTYNENIISKKINFLVDETGKVILE